MDRLPKWARAALRTGLQAAVAVLVVVLPTEPPNDIPGVLTAAGLAAAWAFLVGTVTALHNWAEDTGKIKDRR